MLPRTKSEDERNQVNEILDALEGKSEAQPDYLHNNVAARKFLKQYPLEILHHAFLAALSIPQDQLCGRICALLVVSGAVNGYAMHVLIQRPAAFTSFNQVLFALQDLIQNTNSTVPCLVGSIASIGQGFKPQKNLELKVEGGSFTHVLADERVVVLSSTKRGKGRGAVCDLVAELYDPSGKIIHTTKTVLDDHPIHLCRGVLQQGKKLFFRQLDLYVDIETLEVSADQRSGHSRKVIKTIENPPCVLSLTDENQLGILKQNQEYRGPSPSWIANIHDVCVLNHHSSSPRIVALAEDSYAKFSIKVLSVTKDLKLSLLKIIPMSINGGALVGLNDTQAVVFCDPYGLVLVDTDTAQVRPFRTPPKSLKYDLGNLQALAVDPVTLFFLNGDHYTLFHCVNQRLEKLLFHNLYDYSKIESTLTRSGMLALYNPSNVTGVDIYSNEVFHLPKYSEVLAHYLPDASSKAFPAKVITLIEDYIGDTVSIADSVDRMFFGGQDLPQFAKKVGFKVEELLQPLKDFLGSFSAKGIGMFLKREFSQVETEHDQWMNRTIQFLRQELNAITSKNGPDFIACLSAIHYYMRTEANYYKKKPQPYNYTLAMASRAFDEVYTRIETILQRARELQETHSAPKKLAP